jgi:hypothetical protein
MTEVIWREISCKKAVSGDNFIGGVQDYVFNIGRGSAWLPSKSYFKIDMTLEQGGGGNLKPTTVALAENASSCLWQSCAFLAGGSEVSSVRGFVPQIQQLKTRLTTTNGQQRSIGQVYGIESSQATRLAETTVQNTFSRIFQPPMGLFSADNMILGSSDYSFQMNPNSNFARHAVETTGGAGLTLVPGVPANNTAQYRLIINNIRLYICTTSTSIPDQVSSLELYECRAQHKLVGTGGELNFTVPVGTYAISVFLQGPAVDTDTRLPPTRFKNIDNSERNLTSLQLSYANINKPVQQWTSSYTNDANQIQQRYLETYLESGLFHSQAGSENVKEYVERGMYHHFMFNKDSEDKSTELTVNTTFNADSVFGGTKLFVVAFYKQRVDITSVGGFTTNVRLWSV